MDASLEVEVEPLHDLGERRSGTAITTGCLPCAPVVQILVKQYHFIAN
jgi:hypothetical protein